MNERDMSGYRVLLDCTTGKFIFRGKEYSRNGQAQKAARKAFEKESKK